MKKLIIDLKSERANKIFEMCDIRLIYFIIVIVCFSFSSRVYASEITYDENGIIQFKNTYKNSELMHNKINAFLSDMDVVLAKVSKDTDNELSNFFNNRKHGIKAFADKASGYYIKSEKNKRALRDLFNEYVFSENDINNEVESLLISGSKKLQNKFLEILYSNSIINTKNTDLNNLDVNHQKIFLDTSYMDKNKFNAFCKVTEFAITLPLKFFQGIIAEFLVFHWLPYNQYKAEDEISRLIIKQVDTLKIQIHDEIVKKFKSYNEDLKAELKELLIYKFDE